ncbi:MAG: PKD domain-containing protein, partial [candidate division Zixibacteria bacterium]|nr:PKD domain-containing protein [candidate division Zixibacteria bacterium]
GNGDGTFTTTSFVASGRSWGVTAGDFDNDGKEDIITDGYFGYSFYFYKGNGDGTFQAGTVISGVGNPLTPSPVDNFDFNDDGNMDIMIGYGNYIRYYSGNGDGSFTYVTQIAGGTGYDRRCLSAPPGELIPPGSPVAVAEPDAQTITVGSTADFDGSNSYDTDGGTIVSYEWNFGDGNTGTGITASHTYTTEGRYRVRLRVTDNDGKIGSDYVTVQVCSDCPEPPRVNVMPGNMPGKVYPYAWPGRELTVWGNVHDGTPPYTYVWEFGDGSAPVSGEVTNPRYISVPHTYTTMGPKLAVLTVTDACLVSGQDTVEIEVVTRDFPVEVNAAIEDGLRWLYLEQESDGRWIYSGYPAAATAMALLAFENNQHLPINDINEDIYAEYVQAGLDFLFTTFYSTSVPVQEAGDPEENAPGNTDNNGIGIGVNSSRNGYETGMAMMAIVGSGSIGTPAPDLVATTGPADVIGRTYRDIVVDMVDWCAWAQVDISRGIHRGGWRYTPNYSNSDNSVSQWPAIGLEAAETNWGVAAPSFVKSELLLWLSASQISGGSNDGAFWYMPNWWAYSPIGVTGAGLCALSYADIPNTDPRVTRTTGYLARNWGHSANVNNRYNLYAVAKGCRIAVDSLGDPYEIVSIDGIDWYTDYATNLMAIQQSHGGWPDQWGRVLSSAWAILVLTPSVVGLPPVAVINAPETAPPSTPFNMDGSDSYHKDPDKMIVEWLWDFDKSDGVNWSSPDASGSEVVNPGYSLPVGVLADTFLVTLRVADNGDSVMTDIAEHTVIVNFENHLPIADPGGPYAAKVGEIITLDGTGSYDPDSADYIVTYSWDIDGDGIFGDFT